MIIALAAVATFRIANAYPIPVHRDMSAHSLTRAETSFRQHLGISRTRALKGGDLAEDIGNGAAEEDNNTRSVTHFFDPVHGVPLEVPFPLPRIWDAMATGYAHLPAKQREMLSDPIGIRRDYQR